MSEFFRCLRAAFREVFRPEPWPEPDENEVSRAAFRQWSRARSIHPSAPVDADAGRE